MGDETPLAELISLRGKAAIITGAGAGIGAATARRFAQAGAHLFLLDINEENLALLAAELAAHPINVRTQAIDLSSKAAIDAFWGTLGETAPGILVNNAGIFPFRDFLETDEALVRQVMDVNLSAVYWMCQHFIRVRLKLGGAIVNVGSIEAKLPFKKDLAHYTIGKAAVIALTRTLARDYGSRGFRANVILPGGIITEGTKSSAKGVWRKPELIADGVKFMSRLPLGRIGQADEVALITLVLVSDLASYVTGAAIPVDGGFLSA